MPYLKLNQDDSIADVLLVDPGGGGVEVSKADLLPIVAHQFGHSVFDYVGGAIVLNTARVQALLDAIADAETDVNRGADKFLRALVLALNDGSFVPGSGYTGAQIKAIIKAKL